MGLPTKKILPNADRHLEEVALSTDGRRVIFLFENGEGYSIARKDLPRDDGTPITSIQIFDHRGAVALVQASGETYDLPWDSIKHYAHGGRQKKQTIGLILKKLRGERGLTQENLAKAAGLSRVHLTRLENGISTPTLTTLLKLTHILGVLPKELEL